MQQLLVFALILAAGLAYLSVGQWALIAGLMVIILGHEFGHWFVARMFGIEVPVFSVGFGSQPRLRLGKLWGTEFQITPWLIGGYVQIDPNNDNFLRHAAWKRASVLAAGVTMNAIMAVCFMIAAYAWLGKPVPEIYVNQAVASQPAATAGIHDGDRLVSVDGMPVSGASEVIARVQKHSDGTPVSIVVQRQDQTLNFAVTPTDGKVGIQLGVKQAFHKVGWTEAVSSGASDTWFITKQIGSGLLMMAGLVPKPTGVDTTVHGIVGIVQLGGFAFESGMFGFIWLLAGLNINLMFLNLLPLPLLDGGHLAYIGWEKLTGRRVSQEWQGRVAFISLLMLGSLMVFSLWNDLMHPILTR